MSRKTGPQRTPQHVLKLRGSRLKNRQAGGNVASDGVLRCPAWLDEHGKAEWRRCVRVLSILSPADASALAGMCQNWSLFVRMSARVDAMMADPAGSIMDLRRLSAIASDAFKNYLRAAGCFGVTPMDRQKLDAPVESPPDAMDHYLAKGRRNG